MYYELLKLSETITGDRYRTQLMRSNRALKEKDILGNADLALLWLRKVKKHFSQCNYDSVIKFIYESVGINTIILLFSEKRLEIHHIPVIEDSTVVHHLRKVSTILVDYWLE